MSVIVITGASSGIGAALAEALAGSGKLLVLLGRDASRLERTATLCSSKGAQCVVQAIDVLDDKVMSSFLKDLQERHPIDLLVANAGIFLGRRANEIVESSESASLVLRTNLVATIDQVYSVLPSMLERRQGSILLIASLAGLFPLPDAPAYSASKAGLISYGLALREAVRARGIKVVIACPGYVTTPMIAGHHGLRLGEISADIAARKILQGVKRNKALVGFPFWLFWPARFYLLVPERVRKWAGKAFRFHFS